MNKEVQQLADLCFKLFIGHVSFLARMKFSMDKILRAGDAWQVIQA